MIAGSGADQIRGANFRGGKVRPFVQIATLSPHPLIPSDQHKSQFDYAERPHVWELLRWLLSLALLIFQFVTSITSSGNCDDTNGIFHYNVLRKHLPFASDVLSGVECVVSYLSILYCRKINRHQGLEKEGFAAGIPIAVSMASIICSFASVGECPAIEQVWISWIQHWIVVWGFFGVGTFFRWPLLDMVCKTRGNRARMEGGFGAIRVSLGECWREFKGYLSIFRRGNQQLAVIPTESDVALRLRERFNPAVWNGYVIDPWRGM